MAESHIKPEEMKTTLQLMKNFETRNNISIVVELYSDGSSRTEEFWKEELNQSSTIDELHTFLKNTQYKLADNGRCIIPIENLND